MNGFNLDKSRKPLHPCNVYKEITCNHNMLQYYFQVTPPLLLYDNNNRLNGLRECLLGNEEYNANIFDLCPYETRITYFLAERFRLYVKLVTYLIIFS